MKIKNFFNALIMAFLTISLFISCDQTTGDDSIVLNKDGIYLLGNCTDPINSREDGRFGMNDNYTIAMFTTLAGEDLLAHGDAIVGVRALIDGEVENAEILIANKFCNFDRNHL